MYLKQVIVLNNSRSSEDLQPMGLQACLVLIWILKLSIIGKDQYFGGLPLGSSRCCWREFGFQIYLGESWQSVVEEVCKLCRYLFQVEFLKAVLPFWWGQKRKCEQFISLRLKWSHWTHYSLKQKAQKGRFQSFIYN